MEEEEEEDLSRWKQCRYCGRWRGLQHSGVLSLSLLPDKWEALPSSSTLHAEQDALEEVGATPAPIHHGCYFVHLSDPLDQATDEHDGVFCGSHVSSRPVHHWPALHRTEVFPGIYSVEVSVGQPAHEPTKSIPQSPDSRLPRLTSHAKRPSVDLHPRVECHDFTALLYLARYSIPSRSSRLTQFSHQFRPSSQLRSQWRNNHPNPPLAQTASALSQTTTPYSRPSTPTPGQRTRHSWCASQPHSLHMRGPSANASLSPASPPSSASPAHQTPKARPPTWPPTLASSTTPSA